MATGMLESKNYLPWVLRQSRDMQANKFDKSSSGVTKAQRFAESLVILNRPFFELVMYVCMILVAWFGGGITIV